MKSFILRGLVAVVLFAGTGVLGWSIVRRLQEQKQLEAKKKTKKPAAVAVAPVVIGNIELRRSFSGTLEAPAAFVVSPRVAGRIEKLSIDIGDVIKRGQVVAELDSAEFVQAVARAKAEAAVAEAKIALAKSAVKVAEKELKRSQKAFTRGVITEADRDQAEAVSLNSKAALKVAEAELVVAQEALKMAQLRLNYTQVTATWTGGAEQRVVSERFVDVGNIVTSNSSLISVVQITPIHGVTFVTERDYGRVRIGQKVDLSTDAYPGETFHGTVLRIAPIFRQSSRQARVELSIANDQGKLKPGLFIRAKVVLERREQVKIVPNSALSKRRNQQGLFVLSDDAQSVSWLPVKVGIRQGQRLEIISDALSGQVVTLGQHLIQDGSKVVVPSQTPKNQEEDQ